jgi:hypothetical protein
VEIVSDPRVPGDLLILSEVDNALPLAALIAALLAAFNR